MLESSVGSGQNMVTWARRAMGPASLDLACVRGLRMEQACKNT